MRCNILDEIVVSLKRVNKSFSGVKVLTNIDLDIYKGDIHAIVGENGAGKSTLVKILMGVYPTESGEITIFGERMNSYNITIARKKGINMVPQELALVPAFTVAENIMMSHKKGNLGFLSQRNITKQAEAYIKEIGFDLNPSIRVDRLPISYRQLVSIVKAVAENAKVIIMDEPTSSLSKEELDELMRIIRKLKEHGTTIIYISHILDEIFNISDKITVLRDGRLITTLETRKTNQREIISHMVGEDLLKTQQNLRLTIGKQELKNEEIPIFEVQNLKRKQDEEGGVSFKLYSGEIVGITGLVGAGKTELIRTIIGLDKKAGGKIFINGKETQIRGPKDGFNKGIAVVPEDRKLEGLVLIRNVEENAAMCVTYRKTISKFGFINKKKEKNDVMSYVDKLNIKITSLYQRLNRLSGGNQQKVVISKVLLSKPRILIVDEPTRGIDIGAKTTIYKLIRELKDKGISILFFSSDISEMPFVGDRILIMRKGKIEVELKAEEATLRKMLNYVSGGKDYAKA